MVTLLAVLVLGGGSAYAIERAANNSVDSEAIINGEVKPQDLQNNTEFERGLHRDAVKVQPKRLTAADLRVVNPKQSTELTRVCLDKADVAVGGGVEWAGGGSYGPILSSYPFPSSRAGQDRKPPDGWTVLLRNDTDAAHSVVLYVVCVNGSK